MSKVDIIKKHIGSDDFYDLNGTEMLSKILAAMDEYAKEQVKLFAISAVVGRSEQLVCENCGEVEVKEQGDWCDRCLGIDEEAN